MGRPKGSISAPQILLDFRHVYQRDENADKTPGQKMLRKMFDENPKEFLMQMRSEEYRFAQLRAKSKQANKSADGAKEEQAEDIGTTKAVALLEEWLADYKREHPEAV